MHEGKKEYKVRARTVERRERGTGPPGLLPPLLLLTTHLLAWEELRQVDAP